MIVMEEIMKTSHEAVRAMAPYLTLGSRGSKQQHLFSLRELGRPLSTQTHILKFWRNFQNIFIHSFDLERNRILLKAKYQLWRRASISKYTSHSSTKHNKTISEFHAYFFSVRILFAEGGVGGEEDVFVPALVARVLGLQPGGPPARAQEGGEQSALSSHQLVLGTEVGGYSYNFAESSGRNSNSISRYLTIISGKWNMNF